MPFSFENSLTPAPNRKRSTSGRKVASRISAPCSCYEMDMTCPHTVKERTTTLGDSTSVNAGEPIIPKWRMHFEVSRTMNTQQYNASKV